MAGGRNEVLGVVVTDLMNIAKGNLYNNDVQKVERKMIPVDQIHAFPILMVLGGREKLEGGMGGEDTGDMQIRVRGYTMDQEDPEITLESLVDDIVKWAYSGHNTQFDLTWVNTIDTDEGWLHLQTPGLGMLEIGITIKRQFNPSSL